MRHPVGWAATLGLLVLALTAVGREAAHPRPAPEVNAAWVLRSEVRPLRVALTPTGLVAARPLLAPTSSMAQARR